MNSDDLKLETRREWRQLGFFYDRDGHKRTWPLVGSRNGLLRFCDQLAAFATDSRNEPTSEHVHLGPYMYLKIGSWPTPQITDDWFAGPLGDLRNLSDTVRVTIERSREGDVVLVRDVFSPGSPYELAMEVQEEDFDPAKEDAGCW